MEHKEVKKGTERNKNRISDVDIAVMKVTKKMSCRSLHEHENYPQEGLMTYYERKVFPTGIEKQFLLTDNIFINKLH